MINKNLKPKENTNSGYLAKKAIASYQAKLTSSSMMTYGTFDQFLSAVANRGFSHAIKIKLKVNERIRKIPENKE